MLAGLLAFPAACWPADDLLTSQMVDEARTWQSKGRMDLAGNTWRRILITHPEHLEALASLGALEAKAGNWSEARSLYQRAKRQGKSSLALTRLESLLKQNAGETDPAARSTTTSVSVGRTQAKALTEPSRNDSLGSTGKDVASGTPLRATNVPAREPKESKASRANVAVPITMEPVAPPNAEVRVTPLPLAPIPSSRTSALSADETDMALKPSDSLRNMATPSAGQQPAVANTSTTRRPKPCRLPLTSTTTPGAH